MTEVCPVCRKPFATLNTQIHGDSRVRYVGCRQCGVRPSDNKKIIPIQFAPARATSSTK